MLSCLCRPCFRRQPRSEPHQCHINTQPPQQSATDEQSQGVGTAAIEAADAAGIRKAASVSASDLEPHQAQDAAAAAAVDPPAQPSQVIIPSSPFTTAQRLEGTSAHKGLALPQAHGSRSRVVLTPTRGPPGSVMSAQPQPQPRRASVDSSANPDIVASTSASVPPPTLDAPAIPSGSSGQCSPSQSLSQRAIATAPDGEGGVGGVGSLSSTQPSSSLPSYLHLIHQVTGSSQSAGGVTAATVSLTTLPTAGFGGGNPAHLHSAATLRSEGGTEATARLPDNPSLAPPPSTLLASEASTSRLIDYLSPDSAEHGAPTGGGGVGLSTATSASGALGRAAGATQASSPPGIGAGGGRLPGGGVRAGVVGIPGGPGSGFSLFGALQAFVEQKQSDIQSANLSSSLMPACTAAAAAGASFGTSGPSTTSAEPFRGFGSETLTDVPTARLNAIQQNHPPSAAAASAVQRGGRRRGGGEAGGLPPSPLGSGAATSGGAGSQRPSSALGGLAGCSDTVGSDTELALAAVIIIGGPTLGSNSSSTHTTQDRLVVPAAAVGTTAAAGGGGSGYSGSFFSGGIGVGGDGAAGGVPACGGGAVDGDGGGLQAKPASGHHSNEGTVSLLSGPSNLMSFDEQPVGKAAGGRYPAGAHGIGVGGAGSDTENVSRMDNTAVLADGSGGGGGGDASRRRGGGGGGGGSRGRLMQRNAERREFLSAARCINAVLQDVQVISVLGAGAHGKVYKGAFRDRFVAVKVILHETDAPSGVNSGVGGMRHVPSTQSLWGVGWSTTGGQSGTLPPTSAGPAGASSPSGVTDATNNTNTHFSTAAGGGGNGRPRPASTMSNGLGSGSDGLPSTTPEVALVEDLPVMTAVAFNGLDKHDKRRGSGSGSVPGPAVHMLRYQRAGSSNLHALPLNMPGSNDGGFSHATGGSGGGPASLPVLSLPGMMPVVMPHKHMLEGLISASAQHPNIVETYRIVTQLLSAPSMPAFTVTRGSHTPLWETTNLNGTALFGLANTSASGGGGGGGGGGPQGRPPRLQRASSLGPKREHSGSQVTLPPMGASGPGAATAIGTRHSGADGGGGGGGSGYDKSRVTKPVGEWVGPPAGRGAGVYDDGDAVGRSADCGGAVAGGGSPTRRSSSTAGNRRAHSTAAGGGTFPVPGCMPGAAATHEPAASGGAVEEAEVAGRPCAGGGGDGAGVRAAGAEVGAEPSEGGFLAGGTADAGGSGSGGGTGEACNSVDGRLRGYLAQGSVSVTAAAAANAAGATGALSGSGDPGGHHGPRQVGPLLEEEGVDGATYLGARSHLGLGLGSTQFLNNDGPASSNTAETHTPWYGSTTSSVATVAGAVPAAPGADPQLTAARLIATHNQNSPNQNITSSSGSNKNTNAGGVGTFTLREGSTLSVSALVRRVGSSERTRGVRQGRGSSNTGDDELSPPANQTPGFSAMPGSTAGSNSGIAPQPQPHMQTPRPLRSCAGGDGGDAVAGLGPDGQQRNSQGEAASEASGEARRQSLLPPWQHQHHQHQQQVVGPEQGAAQSSAQVSGDGNQEGSDPDSAELILDLLGAQAAAQRSHSFLMRQRQMQQQQQQELVQQQLQQQQPRLVTLSTPGGADGRGGGGAEDAGTGAEEQRGEEAGGGRERGAAGQQPLHLQPPLLAPVVPRASGAPRLSAGVDNAAPWCVQAGGEADACARILQPGVVIPVGGIATKRPGGAIYDGALANGCGSGSEPPSGDLPAYDDYMVADESGTTFVPNTYQMAGLSTALFSSYRNSYGAMDYGGSLSGFGPGGAVFLPSPLGPTGGFTSPNRMGHAFQGQQAGGVGSGSGGIGPRSVAGILPLSLLCAGGGAAAAEDAPPLTVTEVAAATTATITTAAASSRYQHSGNIADSCASNASAPYIEASLALPAPLPTSAVAMAAAPPAALTHGSAGSPALATITNSSTSWLPTIDELSTTGATGVPQHEPSGQAPGTPQPGPSPGPRQPLAQSQQPQQQSVSGARDGNRSSAASTVRHPLHRTVSVSSGGGGGTRTSAGSGASLPSGATTLQRGLLYGGQLMPSDVQYDKLSWSNHTHTSASTNAMLNSGFTALLASINTVGGGSNPGGGGGGGNFNSSVVKRHVDSSGIAGLQGYTSRQRTANTAATDADAPLSGDTDLSTLPQPLALQRVAGTAAATGGSRQRSGGAAGGDLLRSLASGEPLSRSFSDARTSRTDPLAQRRAATASLAASPWALGALAGPGRERWQVLIVQELCTRGNLRDAIASGVFHSSNTATGTQVIAMRQLLDTASEIASAMSYLHSRSIVHGDLKTANVLLQRNDADPRGFVAKLADFGLARQLGPRSAEDGLLVSRIGTVTHMAPETIRDNRVLLSSDVYSFGVIMWELYCAQQPFANYSAFQLLSAVVQYDERPQFPVHCPSSYTALAIRCMAKNPQDRPAFAEVYGKLLAIRDELYGGNGQGTISVPLTQARSEATRILQSHLQIVSGSVTGVGGGGGVAGAGGGGGSLVSGTFRGDAALTQETSSLESWDVCTRHARR